MKLCFRFWLLSHNYSKSHKIPEQLYISHYYKLCIIYKCIVHIFIIYSTAQHNIFARDTLWYNNFLFVSCKWSKVGKKGKQKLFSLFFFCVFLIISVYYIKCVIILRGSFLSFPLLMKTICNCVCVCFYTYIWLFRWTVQDFF